MKNFFDCCVAIVILCFISIPFLATSKIAAGAQLDAAYQKSVPPGVLLLLLTETVADVIKTVDMNDYATDDEVLTDSHGRQIAITKMMIAFKPEATPLQLEQLLDSLNATITSSIARTRSVVVRIPKPDSLEAYYALIDQIEAEPFIDFVWHGEIPRFDALPSNYYDDPPHLNELTYIDNHLAIRTSAAWNASRAIDANYKPQVVVADAFGEGPPFNNTINSINNSGFNTDGWEGGHGYEVLGIIAGTHGQYYTTGIYPGTINLQVVDHPDDGSPNRFIFAEIMNKLLITLTRTPGKLVVNTSIGYVCDGTGGNCIDIAEAREVASLWIEYSQMFGLEDRVLHVTSAGNMEITGIRDASTNSPFASAALLGGLTNGFGQPLGNLTNTVVVENALNDTVVDTQPVSTKCLYKDSFVGGMVSGIGTNVRSFTYANGVESDQLFGTSYSTPQVAGLAAYLWSIDHSLFPQQIKNLLFATSNSVPVISDQECSDWPSPAPIVDAYEALLALDAADMPDSSNSPVRFAILDVNGDNSFDEDDLQLFIDTYYDTSGPEPVLIEPDVPDYGRKDLNGDGWTGGSNAIPFDLDRVGSSQYGASGISNVTQNINGTTVGFNEATVRDTDILCYYAYSALYNGDNTERQNLLEGICQRTDINCTYTSYLDGGSYTKTCYDPSNETNTKYVHEFPPANNILERIRLEIRDESSRGMLVKQTDWAKILNQEPALDCDIGKPTGWFVGLSIDVETGQNEYFLIDPYNIFFPKEYQAASNVTRSYCWPDFNSRTLECGAYSCPPIESIQPALAFPGDCHQWWDHYDENGLLVECNY